MEKFEHHTLVKRMPMDSIEDESGYRQDYQRLCDRGQPLLKTKDGFDARQLERGQNSRPKSEDILNKQPAIKKPRHLDQHTMTDGPMEETFSSTSLDGGDYHRSRPPSPERAYSDHYVTKARVYLDSGDIAADDQSLCSEENLVPRSLVDCSADFETTRENVFVNIRKYFESGRRNAVFGKLDIDVNAARGRSETDFNLRKISDQMELLTVSRKRKR